MGIKYVVQMLSWYLSKDKTFLFHLEDESGGCVGFCGGIINDGTLQTGSASGMAQHSFGEAVKAFLQKPWLIFHPEIRAKAPLLWRNIKMKFGFRTKNLIPKEQRKFRSQVPQAGLVVIGVLPQSQGKGYGSLLLKEFERRAVEVYGIRNLQLTVRADNFQAIKAYQKNGWSVEKTTGNALSMVKLVSEKSNIL